VTQPTHVVVSDPALLPLAVRESGEDGWATHSGFVLPDDPWDVSEQRVVCSGELRTPGDASAALLCAARGARLVVAVSDELMGTVYDDLRRLGSVEEFAVDRPATAPTGLADDQVQLLRLLAAGHSLREAARRMYLAQRTAERRLAAARRTLGATTTAEALIRFGAMN